jgi:adenylate kinase family enzyme
MIDAEDFDAQLKDRLVLKLLRVTSATRDGFILTDFPNCVAEAEMLEEFRGGMNSFVHVGLPDSVMLAIENLKLACNNCGREYFPEDIHSHEHNVHIEAFLPQDGHCFDCGSRDIVKSGNMSNFKGALANYKKQKDEILGFYDHLGLLVDFDLKNGFEDYEKLKEQIQINIKH